MTTSHHSTRLAAWLSGVGAVLAFVGFAGTALGQTELDHKCAPCHFASAAPNAPGIDQETYTHDVHAGNTCVSCHEDIEDEGMQHELPHQDLMPVECGSCHPKEAELHTASIHGLDIAKKHEESDAARCYDCHTLHGVRRASDPLSSTHPANLPVTCARCHADQEILARNGLEETDAYEQFEKGVHAKPDPKAGRPIAATCNDCHGTHNIAALDDPNSTIHHDRIAATCGKCHATVEEEYRTSVHGRPLEEGDDEEKPRASCSSCHFTHGVAPANDSDFQLHLVDECGTCHARMMKSYKMTYHGKANTLSDLAVAKCSDCHGSHAVLAIDDPKSSVHPNNKLETCVQCHGDAPEGFENFWAHADYHDAERYPILYYTYVAMTGLLLSVFSFFGLHTLLWWIRGCFEWLGKRQRGEPTRHAHSHSSKHYSRFQKYHRLTHLAVVTSFLGLAFTGAPLKFEQAEWAQTIFALLGGVKVAGLLHRCFAVITFCYFAAHVGFLVINTYRQRHKGLLKVLFGPDSLVPSLTDVKDISAHFRWFFGIGPKPTWERWTYWEKFDYWAVFWGVGVIGFSGLVLWFPEMFANVLPGWVVNIAFLIHSDEALLAMGFIFVVHFFNGHVRVDKFPVDPVIFTGQISEEEFKSERGRHYARLQAEGRLEELETKQVPSRIMFWVHLVAILAWMAGSLVIVLIITGAIFG